MRRVLPILCFVVATASSAGAGDNCTCRAPGFEVFEGETACLNTANGPQLARCGRVLNNTSWTFLNTPCPSAKLQSAPADVSSLADADATGFLFLR